MTVKEIIDGLKFTVDMFLFDPTTGETYKEPRNDMDKTTIDACKGAIELLEQTRWIPVSEKLPKECQKVLVIDKFEAVTTAIYFEKSPFWREMVVAWMPLPSSYQGE